MLKKLVLIVAALAFTVALPELWSSGQLRAEDGIIVAANDAAKTSLLQKAQQKDNAPKPLYVNVDHGYPLELKTPAASVFIANPDIADVQVMSPTSIMIFGKRTGDTTFMATDAAGTTLENRTIRVVQDLSTLRREINNIIPGNKVRVESVPNGIVLAGAAKDSATIADVFKLAQRYLPASGGDIINRIRVGGSNQVQIRVRFAEVARNVDNSLGFNWQSIGQLGGFTFGLASGVSALAGASSVISTRPSNTGLSLPNDVIGISRKFGDKLTVDGLIDALAQDGLVSILAEPTLTAMSGETANFLAGGEFPVPIPQGNGTISISFKSYGISLAFTPTLIGENRINLHVRPEVSQLTSAGSIVESNITVPAISTRRAETTVEVSSGQSFAIAGLLDNNQTQTVNKYPLLGDLPVIGALFRSTRFQNGQTELVIIITPYIVRPTGEKLALPTDGYSPPSEEERLMDLRYSSADSDKRTMSGQPDGTREASVPSMMAPAPVAPVASQPTHPLPRKHTKPHAKHKAAPAHKPPLATGSSDITTKPQPPADTATPSATSATTEAPPPATTPQQTETEAKPVQEPVKTTDQPTATASSPDKATAQPETKAESETQTNKQPEAAPQTSPPAPPAASTEQARKPAHKKKPHPTETKQAPAPVSPQPGDHTAGTGGFMLE